MQKVFLFSQLYDKQMSLCKNPLARKKESGVGG